MESIRITSTLSVFRKNNNRKFEVIIKVDVGSDHRMVRAKLKINKKLMRLKHIKQQKPMKLRIDVLEAKRDEFEINLRTDLQR